MRGARASWLRGTIAAAAVGLAAGCHPATAAQDPCAAPPPWPAPGAKPGQPDAELAACLKAQAWEIRNLSIPARSAVGGIIAQCEIRVDQFENVTIPQDDSAREARAQQLATAAVAQSRQCAGK